jgi:hypothetical protein
MLKRKVVVGCAWVAFFALAQKEPALLIALELTGGDHAGHYELQDNSGCLHYWDGEWSLSYSIYLDEPSGHSPDTLGMVSLDAPESGGRQFVFSAGLGDPNGDYRQVTLDPASGLGTGSATVEKDDTHTLFHVTGETSDGVQINARLECLSITYIRNDPKDVREVAFSFPPDAASPTGSLELQVGEGSYALRTGDEATCGQNVAQQGDFFYEYEPGGNYTAVKAYLPNLEEAKQGTSRFGFGFEAQPVYGDGDADGTLRATQDGEQVRLELALETPQGIPVRATLVCLVH